MSTERQSQGGGPLSASFEQPVSRRTLLQRGLMTVAGFTFGQELVGTYKSSSAVAARAKTAVPAKTAKAKSVIQIFLWGGMSHNDTWDPKPDSGYETEGYWFEPSGVYLESHKPQRFMAFFFCAFCIQFAES